MTTFRIATLNVHSFGRPKDLKINIDELVSILKPYDLDLIGVQEISDGDYWPKFCERLGLSYHAFGGNEQTFFGNGIASKYPIKSYSNQETTFSAPGGSRALLKCSLDGDHSFINDRTFAVTHLDHKEEVYRLKQIEQFDPINNNIDILLGDMNALTEDDYTPDFFQKNIFELREKNCWEKPIFDLTKLITNQWNYIDTFKQIHPEYKDEHVLTSRFKTRIDYIYFRPKTNDTWILKDSFIINTNNATDHNAVFALFQLNN